MTFPEWPSRTQFDTLKTSVQDLADNLPAQINSELAQVKQDVDDKLGEADVVIASANQAIGGVQDAKQAALYAAELTYANLNTLPQFRSTTTADPPIPSEFELALYPALGGTKLGPNAGLILLIWVPHSLKGEWTVAGPEIYQALPQADSQSDLAASATLAQVIAAHNQLLADLRTVKLLKDMT